MAAGRSGSLKDPVPSKTFSLFAICAFSAHTGFFFLFFFISLSKKKEKEKSLFFLASDGRLRAEMDNAGPHYRRLEERGRWGREVGEGGFGGVRSFHPHV